MRTISVKEAAEALGIGTRAIQYKLQNGDLKGTRQKNQFGVQEWRVWPTKEIAEGLKKKDESETADTTLDFAPEEILAVDVEPLEQSPKGDPESFTNQIVETLWDKLAGKFFERLEQKDHVIGQKDQLIGELRAELSDKDRRLKLLPDLEKIAEEERKAAQIKAFEVEALRKQVAALQRPWWKKVFGKTANKLNSIAG